MLVRTGLEFFGIEFSDFRRSSGIVEYGAAQHRQSIVEKPFTAGIALELSAGCLGDASGPEQHYSIWLDIVVLYDCMANLPGDYFYVDIPISTFYLMNDYQLLFAFYGDAECCSATRPQNLQTAFNREFDILRIKISATNDDQIFKSARDEELIVVQYPHVPGPQKIPAIPVCR